MQGLIFTLSALDAGSENSVRVISFFDALIEQQVSTSVLARESAAFAECGVGVKSLDGQMALRAWPDGRVAAGGPPNGAMTHSAGPDHEVWLERTRECAVALDDILLERLALACISSLARDTMARPSLNDGALLELVLSRTAEVPERMRALQLLGLSPSEPVSVLAVSGPAASMEAFARSLSGRATHNLHRSFGDYYAVVVVGEAAASLAAPKDVRVGIGSRVPASDAASSWDKACRALRFTARAGYPSAIYGSAMVRADDLGPLELLAAQLRSQDITGVVDLEVFDELLSEPDGVQMLRTLEVYVASGSLREAARQLHLHHNSVSARLERIEKRIGVSITGSEGIARMSLSLALHRLRAQDLPV